MLLPKVNRDGSCNAFMTTLFCHVGLVFPEFNAELLGPDGK
jgi:hypothetical protein